ncbi:hypothetical protein LguiA_014605 [Lonicera macranthoides]
MDPVLQKRLKGAPSRPEEGAVKFNRSRLLEQDSITVHPPSESSPYPRVSFKPEFRATLEVKWKNSIIPKVLGRSVSCNFLYTKLIQLWKPQGEYSLLELGNDFFLFKTNDVETIDRALTEGPWIIAGNYLILQWWRSRFCASRGVITSVSV